MLTVPALAAARRLARRRPAAALVQVLLWGALFRALLLPVGLAPGAGLAAELAGRRPAYDRFLLYDNDVWRYLWDGHLTAAGLDPYRITPAHAGALAEAGDPRFEALFADPPWWDVWDNVSFRTYTSVYPPAAQLLFLLAHLLAPGSVLVWKLLVAVLDLVTCCGLAALLKHLGRPPEASLLYAWNPLAIKEFAGSGHVDALAVALLTLAVLALLKGRGPLGAALFAGSVLAKLAPLLLAGPVLRRAGRRGRWLLPAVLVLGALPFAAAAGPFLGGLAAYAREWTFNPGPFALVAGLLALLGAPAALARGLCAAGAVAVAAAITLRDRGGDGRLVAGGFVILAAVVLLSPAVMPWYLLWALPLAVAAGVRSWVLLTALSLLSYLFYVDLSEHAWWLWLEYGLFAAALAAELATDAPLRARLAAVFRAPVPAAR